MMLALLIIISFYPFLGLAGELTTRDGKVLTGVVVDISEDTVTFLWQRPKAQNEKVKDDDIAFSAQGDFAVKQELPIANIEKVNGIPIAHFKSLFRYNLFHRIFTEMEAFWIRTGSKGNFVYQIISVVVGILLVAVGIPLLFILVSTMLQGERFSFFSALLLVIFLTLMGFCGSYLSVFIVNWGETFTQPWLQVFISIILIGLFSLIITLFFKFYFLNGIVYSVIWGLAFFILGKISDRIP